MFFVLLLIVVVLVIQTHNQNNIMAKMNELNDNLKLVAARLEKGLAEIVAEINILKDAEVPADVQASIDRLTALAAQLDDLTPEETDSGGVETPTV